MSSGQAKTASRKLFRRRLVLAMAADGLLAAKTKGIVRAIKGRRGLPRSDGRTSRMRATEAIINGPLPR